MLLRGEAEKHISYSQVFPLNYRGKIYLVGCFHGAEKTNSVWFDGRWVTVETFGIERYDVAIHTTQIETPYLEHTVSVTVPKTAQIVWDSYEIIDGKAVLTNESFKVSPKLIYCCDRSHTAPMMPHIVSNSAPKRASLKSLSGSPLVDDQTVYGFLSQTPDMKQLLFVHISVALRCIRQLDRDGFVSDVPVIPFNLTRISFNDNDYGYLVDRSGTKEVPIGSIITAIGGVRVGSDGLDIDGTNVDVLSFVALRYLSGDRLTLDLLTPDEKDDYFEKQIEITLPEFDSIASIPFGSKSIKLRDHVFAELSDKIYHDIIVTHGREVDDHTVSLAETLDFGKRSVIVLTGSEVKPKVKKRVMYIPHLVSVNGVPIVSITQLERFVGKKTKMNAVFCINGIEKRAVL